MARELFGSSVWPMPPQLGTLAGLRAAAEAVMAEHDEETTGSVALDNLINEAMALTDATKLPRVLALAESFVADDTCRHDHEKAPVLLALQSMHGKAA